MENYLEMPWSIENTIENLKKIKECLQKQVILRNLHGKGKKDAEEVAFDFDRAIGALEKQIPMEVTDIHVDDFTCPACGCEDTTLDIKQVPEFCQNCGQALYQKN